MKLQSDPHFGGTGCDKLGSTTQVYKSHYFGLVSSYQLDSHLILIRRSRAPHLPVLDASCSFSPPPWALSASFPSKSYLLELRLKNKAHAQGSWWGGGIQKFKTIVKFLRVRGREELLRPVTSSPHKGQGPLMCWQVQGPDAEIISHHYFFHFPRREWKMNTIYLPHGKIQITLEQVVC